MKKVIIFGAATGGKFVANKLLNNEWHGGGDKYEILFFVDNDTKKHGSIVSIQGSDYAVKAPSTILKTDFDKVVVGSICGENIISQLHKDFHIPMDKIDSFLVDSHQESLKNFLNHFQEICKEKQIQGSVAELGVYQGDTAKVLNQIFKDKKLYLFDTFEGYNEKDIKSEKNNDACKLGTGHLSNTSLDLVMSKMSYPKNVIIKKGWFPQSVQNDENLEKEKFCFVNLDPDLYEVVLAGLEYFYPKLVQGGIITFGYFSPHTGPKKAADEFMAKYKIVNFIPLGMINIAAIVKNDKNCAM